MAAWNKAILSYQTQMRYATQHVCTGNVCFERHIPRKQSIVFHPIRVCSDLVCFKSECVQNWTLSYMRVFRLAAGNKTILLHQTQMTHATQRVCTGNVCFERHIPRKQLIVFHPILSVFRSECVQIWVCSKLNTFISWSVQSWTHSRSECVQIGDRKQSNFVVPNTNQTRNTTCTYG